MSNHGDTGHGPSPGGAGHDAGPRRVPEARTMRELDARPRIEDYAFLGDLHTAALVSLSGSVDWYCVPRFDSDPCFARLLGKEEHGFWRVRPKDPATRVVRRYRGDTMILETTFSTPEGTVRLIDLLSKAEEAPTLVRIVEGVEGRVPMEMDLAIRFDFGRTIPWVRRRGGALHAVAGPHALILETDVPTRGSDHRTVADFEITRGDRASIVMTWYASHLEAPVPTPAGDALAVTERWWEEWTGRSTYRGPWRDAVTRSLITLKGMIYAPSGGIVAAPTTSLPEHIGGERNWDYRFCWLRDATAALSAFLSAGYVDEAKAWRDWLVRAVAGDPRQIQPLYGILGERRLDERDIGWLPGYEESRPVRRGNAAAHQLQLDVFGDVMDMLHLARTRKLDRDESAWQIQKALAAHLEEAWTRPDSGIWEIRGEPRAFTHSKVMVWTAFDRLVKAVETFGHEGPVDRWRKLRAEIHREICARAFDPGIGAFVQAYGTKELDAGALVIPLVGFLPASDPRVISTVDVLSKRLTHDGLVYRYDAATDVDGVPGPEGAFLLCTLWLASDLALLGRASEARRCFERVLALANDVGLLGEEYDPHARRFLGNFPQAFSHLGVVNTACHLAGEGPTELVAQSR